MAQERCSRLSLNYVTRENNDSGINRREWGFLSIIVFQKVEAAIMRTSNLAVLFFSRHGQPVAQRAAELGSPGES